MKVINLSNLAREIGEKIRTKYLPRGSLREAMVSGAFWSLFGAILSKGFALIVAIFIARTLGKEGFGLWGLVLAATNMFNQFAIMGLETAATKYVAELRLIDPHRAGKKLSFILTVGLVNVIIVGGAFAALAHWISVSIFNAQRLVDPMLFAGVMLCMMILLRILQGALAGFEDFRAIAVSELIQGVSILMLIPLIVDRYKIEGAVFAMIISFAFASVFSFIQVHARCVKHGMKLGISGIRRERSILWSYAAPSILINALSAPADVGARSFVTRVPGGFSGLGGYQAAVNWQSIVAFVPNSIGRIMLPTLSKLIGQRDYRRIIKVLRANILLNISLALIIAIPVVICGKWILDLYGEGFRNDWDILSLLCGVGMLDAICAPIVSVMPATNRMWWNVTVAAAWAVCLFGGSYLAVPHMGVRGYVYAFVAAKTITTLLYSAGAWRSLTSCKKEFKLGKIDITKECLPDR